MSEIVHPVLTIGHSTHTAEAFIGLLRLHCVEVVVDVRSSPFSRFNPQFNRDALKTALKANGLKYLFLGKELGARSDDDSCYENGRVQYGRLAQTPLFRSGLARVIKGADQCKLALMCAEKEPLECHRTLLVARALVEQSVTVVHIHADGHLESYEESINRLFVITGIPKEDFFRSREDLLAEAFSRQEQRVAYVDEKMVHGIGKEDYP